MGHCFALPQRGDAKWKYSSEQQGAVLAFVAKHAAQGDAAHVSTGLIRRVLSYLVLGPPKPSAADAAQRELLVLQLMQARAANPTRVAQSARGQNRAAHERRSTSARRRFAVCGVDLLAVHAACHVSEPKFGVDVMCCVGVRWGAARRGNTRGNGGNGASRCSAATSVGAIGAEHEHLPRGHP